MRADTSIPERTSEIGANNAVFTIVNAVLLRSMPFPKSEQLAVFLTRDIRGQQSGVSLLDFDESAWCLARPRSRPLHRSHPPSAS